jgi:hypothetical protein
VGGPAFRRCAAELEALARKTRLYLGGAGAAATTLEIDVPRLAGDPVYEAEQLTRHAAVDRDARVVRPSAELTPDGS